MDDTGVCPASHDRGEGVALSPRQLTPVLCTVKSHAKLLRLFYVTWSASATLDKYLEKY